MFEQALVPALLCWSSLALLAGWLLPARAQPFAIAASGAGFLATTAPLSLAVLAPATALTYVIGRDSRATRFGVPAGIVLITGGYLWFTLTGRADSDDMMIRVVLPLGMAFYSLRLIHYLFETYKGSLRPHGLGEYLCYHLLPPVLPVGPVHRFDPFLRDLRRRRWDADQFSWGLGRTLYGLAKIVLLGQYLLFSKLSPVFDEWMALPGLTGTYLTALIFWIRLYVMFSGFSDMAVGLSAAMGFRVVENFNRPFLARDIGDFWRRWHISLSNWCRDYVYSPVMATLRNHSLAVLSAMIVLGLWHGPSLHYLLWGGYHGLGIAVHRRLAQRFPAPTDGLSPSLQRLWEGTAVVLTLHYVVLSFPVTTTIEHWLTGS